MVLVEEVMMLKLLAFIALVAIGWYAYHNIAVKEVNLCVGETDRILPITCQDRQDCVDYLTSPVSGEYPKTPMTEKMLDDHASCKMGQCYVREFSYLDTLPGGCASNQMLYKYPMTTKDMVEAG